MFTRVMTQSSPKFTIPSGCDLHGTAGVQVDILHGRTCTSKFRSRD